MIEKAMESSRVTKLANVMSIIWWADTTPPTHKPDHSHSKLSSLISTPGQTTEYRLMMLMLMMERAETYLEVVVGGTYKDDQFIIIPTVGASEFFIGMLRSGIKWRDRFSFLYSCAFLRRNVLRFTEKVWWIRPICWFLIFIWSIYRSRFKTPDM